MTIIRLVILAFALLEMINVIVLYFAPNSKLMNSLGIFDAWAVSKEDEGVHSFVQFLSNRLAGTKLLLILLLIVIAWAGSEQLLIFTCFAIALALASFFWRLFSQIQQMEADGQITFNNYSMILGVTIGMMIFVFFAATIPALFNL